MSLRGADCAWLLISATKRHRVTNWAAYDIALRQRGSLTVWFTEAAIAAWKAEPRCTRGGHVRHFHAAVFAHERRRVGEARIFAFQIGDSFTYLRGSLRSGGHALALLPQASQTR